MKTKVKLNGLEKRVLGLLNEGVDEGDIPGIIGISEAEVSSIIDYLMEHDLV